jgi:hypothetical protein
MNEKIENAETTEETTEPITEQAQDKKPKVTFTPEQQLQINSLLKREREKEEAKWKDLLTAKDTQITEFEGGLQKVIEVQTADFEPVVLSLLKDLPVLEQWKKLSDTEFVTSARRKNVIPRTPKAEGEQQPKKFVPFGGR